MRKGHSEMLAGIGVSMLCHVGALAALSLLAVAFGVFGNLKEQLKSSLVVGMFLGGIVGPMLVRRRTEGPRAALWEGGTLALLFLAIISALILYGTVVMKATVFDSWARAVSTLCWGALFIGLSGAAGGALSAWGIRQLEDREGSTPPPSRTPPSPPGKVSSDGVYHL